MHIISHRGFWQTTKEKNTITAFNRSFAAGFGIETDLRDCLGDIVISHDMPLGGEMRFIELLQLADNYAKDNKHLTLALNIKADGLVKKIIAATSAYSNLDYFVFDMSIPDMRSYLDTTIPVFTRISEFEKNAAYEKQTSGVWLDSFEKEIWFSAKYLEELLTYKRVCLVSPELHGYNHELYWSFIKPFAHSTNLILCTDLPDEASRFFGVPNAK